VSAEGLPDLFSEAAGGDASAKERLFAALYDELKRVAARELRRAGGASAMSPTTLLHEAYLDISRGDARFPDRPRFIAYAARAMRGLVIDFARERRAQKRGGAFEITRFDTVAAERVAAPATRLERLSDALDALASAEPALAQVVDLKYFCGFTFGEIAAIRGVAERTVQRDWEKARLFLYGALQEGLPD
jgi:RNA polymerase sigma factor (TIGR02999 family)